MNLDELINIIEGVLPIDSALSGDKVGLQIEAENNINKALICLEITDEVVSEAVDKECDLILAFHPLIFNPLIEIRQNERVGRLTSSLIKAGISVYIVHTTFDVYENGTSDIIANKIGLVDKQFLIPDENYENKGMGVIGVFNGSKDELLEKCSQIFNSPLKFNQSGSGNFKKIAIVGGSGGSFLSKVMKTDADVFITADISYHTFHRVEGHLTIIDPGHYEMEQFVPEGLKRLLEDKLTVELELSSSLTNPVRFYPDLNFTSKQKKYLNY